MVDWEHSYSCKVCSVRGQENPDETSFLIGAAALSLSALSACETSNAGRGSYHEGYYDNYYGSVRDGYWNNDGYFYYGGARDGAYVRDDARHFRRERSDGLSHFRVRGGVDLR
jgi:hypothetical protein